MYMYIHIDTHTYICTLLFFSCYNWEKYPFCILAPKATHSLSNLPNIHYHSFTFLSLSSIYAFKFCTLSTFKQLEWLEYFLVWITQKQLYSLIVARYIVLYTTYMLLMCYLHFNPCQSHFYPHLSTKAVFAYILIKSMSHLSPCWTFNQHLTLFTTLHPPSWNILSRSYHNTLGFSSPSLTSHIIFHLSFLFYVS